MEGLSLALPFYVYFFMTKIKVACKDPRCKFSVDELTIYETNEKYATIAEQGFVIGPAVLLTDKSNKKPSVITTSRAGSNHLDTYEKLVFDHETDRYKDEFHNFANLDGFHTTKGFFLTRYQAGAVFKEMFETIKKEPYPKGIRSLYSYDLDRNIVAACLKTL